MYSVVKPALLSLLLTSTALPLIAEEPALPPGLGGSSETAPALPPGLAPEQNATPEPALPSGLFEDSTDDSIADDDSDLSDIYSLGGFAEIRAGAFVNDNPHQNKASIGEARLHLVLDAAYEAVDMRIAVDFLADPVEGNADIDLESGTGPLDLREAWLLMRPTDFADLKLGRQILTWGTGDLVFINDMFPKDFQSFFTGRDDEYLKAPSDAAKLSLFHDMANLDIVYTPRFDADRHLTGRRVNFFNPLANDVTGRNRESITNRPEDWFIDDEWALRLYGDVAATEWAIYAYSGYFKSPNAIDTATGRFTFPELDVYGASLRAPVLAGIAHAEIGYHDSRDDRNGTDPFTPNSNSQLLIGYEQEIAPELNAGLQYHLTRTEDYDAHRANLPAGSFLAPEYRQVVTLRLTQMLMNQTMTLGLFAFYSPSDEDLHLRPKFHWKIDDALSFEAGALLFTGRDEQTFFGQMEDNNSIYTALRFGF